MLNPPCPRDSSKPDTTRFVEVPISVHVPPRIAAKLIGMRNFEGLSPMRNAQSRTAGANIATSGVLFKNPESSAVGTNRRASKRCFCAPGPSTTRVM